MNGSEPAATSGAVAGGDVTTLYGLGGVTATTLQPRAYVAGERDDCVHRLHIWLVMVSNNRFVFSLRVGQGLTKKDFCTGPIPFVPQEHIDDLPILINGEI